MYLPAEIVRRFAAHPGLPYELQVVDRDGHPVLLLEVQLPVGFSQEELSGFAAERTWEVLHEKVEEDGNWFMIFRDRVSQIYADSRPHSGSMILSNISLRGPAFLVPNLETYEPLFNLAKGFELSISIDDPEGLWTRLSGASVIEPADPPQPSEVERFLRVVEGVTCRFEQHVSSLRSRLQDIARWSETVNLASEKAMSYTKVANTS